MTERPSSAAVNAPWPAARSAWYAVFALALTTLFANLDVTIMSLLVQPIKRDFHLTDSRMGLLLGGAFAVFYTFIGLPLARFVDRYSRKTILAIGIATWSAATAFCGLAQNYWQLFLGRVGVGAGESVNGPATFSMISDYFPKERLPRAIAAMQVGVVIGGGLSYLIGAFVIHSLEGLPPIALPMIGFVRNWQLVFIAVGLPGLLVALMMATTVKEPPRRGLLIAEDPHKVTMRAVLGYLREHRSVFGPMFGALAISASLIGARLWLPAFFERTYGWSPQQMGAATGIATPIGTLIGLYIGVKVVERFTRKGRDDAPLRTVIISRLVGIPFGIAAPLMPSPWLAIACDALLGASIGMGGSSQNAALQIVTPNQMRGQVTALYLFIYNVVGLGIGPMVISSFTDFVFRADSHLRYALMTAYAILGPASLLVIWLGVKPYLREVTRLRALER
jgi:MFS family permease